MSTELFELNTSEGTLQATQYSGGKKRGPMVQLTQGQGRFIQLTRPEASMTIVMLTSWLKGELYDDETGNTEVAGPS
jgi:hypothetical protein